MRRIAIRTAAFGVSLALCGSLLAQTETPPQQVDGVSVAESFDDGGIATSGPDVIVGDLTTPSRFGTVGNVTGYAIGTTSCNIGDVDVMWISSTNQHPVISQNLYRLKNGRFEQIGQSWLKHAFTALTQSLCGSCNGHGGSVLGVGCSDPYGAGLNGQQSRLGPRSEVNAYTGFYPYPYGIGWNQSGDAIYKRLQVVNSDLDPALNPGALYFADCEYINYDDALAGNGLNNASYRQVAVGSFQSGGYNLGWAAGATTQRMKPAILAWRDVDPTVTIVNIDVPREGRFIMGYKVTRNADDTWHYEYAIFNLNSDRSGQAFSVPLAPGVRLSNLEFKDVSCHSGEPYSNADWTPTTFNGVLTWATETYATNVNANALRWSTLYNFRFDANSPPRAGGATVLLDLFKPGNDTPVGAAAAAPGPVVMGDLNCDGVVNNLDIDGFLMAVSDRARYRTAYSGCNVFSADTNGDGRVDNFDIDGFVNVLAGGG